MKFYMIHQLENAGDANGDGTRDPNEDEFIEFYNSGLEIDLSGYTISDASQSKTYFSFWVYNSC